MPPSWPALTLVRRRLSHLARVVIKRPHSIAQNRCIQIWSCLDYHKSRLAVIIAVISTIITA